jgi:hypothetical protein
MSYFQFPWNWFLIAGEHGALRLLRSIPGVLNSRDGKLIMMKA